MTTAGMAATNPKAVASSASGDAGRDHRQIGGLRLRDADEAVHDAPDGAEQPDERRGRPNGGENASAAFMSRPRLASMRSSRDATRLLDALRESMVLSDNRSLRDGGVTKRPAVPSSR